MTNLRKDFGGVAAVDDVTLEAVPGEVTALIGPNGSGKTTLLNLVCGFYRPTAGSVRLGEVELGGLAPFRSARAGVARTFQTPLIPKGMRARAFVSTGRYVTHRISMVASILRLPSFWRGSRATDAEALRLLALLGIEHVADSEVTSLPLGTPAGWSRWRGRWPPSRRCSCSTRLAQDWTRRTSIVWKRPSR